MDKIRWIIFDYNGTLTDDADIGHQATNHMLRFYRAPEISLQRFRDTFTTPWVDFYALNGVSAERIDIALHQAEYQKIHRRLARDKLKLYSGVRETLELLKKNSITLGVLSSRNDEDLLSELQTLGIAGFFDAIVGEDNITQDGIRSKKKTDKIIEGLSITEPKHTLYIGDMIPDIHNARSCGFKSGIITTGWQSKERLIKENPDFVFDSFQKIKELFSK